MIANIFKILNVNEKKYLVAISILMIFGAFFEMLGIGLVVPIVLVLIKGKEALLKIEFLSKYEYLINSFSDFQLLFSILFLTVFVYLIKYLFLIFLYLVQYNFSYKILNRIVYEMMENYLKKPSLYFASINSSKLINNLFNQANIFISQVVEPLLLIISEAIVFFGILFFLIYFQPFIVTTATFLLIAPTILVYLLVKNKTKLWGMQQQQYEEKVIKNLQETFQGVKEIKIFQKEKDFLSSFVKFFKKSTEARKNILISNNMPRIWLEFVSIILFSLFIMLYSNIKTADEIISILAIFTLAFFRILPSLNRIIQAIQSLRFGHASAFRIYQELSDYETNVNSGFKNANSFVSFESIQFKNVNFAYNTNTTILKNINIKIKKNDFIGIVGKTGSGKSTFVDILTGLLPHTSGDVLINEKISISEMNKNNWFSCIGYVPQVSNLLDSKIIDNITLEKDENKIDHDHLKFCIQVAEIDTYINLLPKKLYTEVGERAIQISGGQKQRIVVARALYKKPQILILDEATSGLDSDTEEKIINNLKKLGITIVMITHQKKLLLNCSKVLNLDNNQKE